VYSDSHHTLDALKESVHDTVKCIEVSEILTSVMIEQYVIVPSFFSQALIVQDRT
jgi:hypothetical protein